MRIAIINGPNLNLLGRREPSIYGTKSMEQVLLDIQRAYPDLHFNYRQSNHEGDLIDFVQEIGYHPAFQGIVLNAGGYTHTSVALRDAVACCCLPVVEVHISNVHQREEFRHKSMISCACVGVICGFGLDSYRLAIEALKAM